MYGYGMAGGAGTERREGAAVSHRRGSGARGGRPSSWVAETRWRLAAVDAGSLRDRERVELVAELERVKGAASAAQARATRLAAVSREVVAPRDVARSVGSEVALARRESPSLGDRFVGLTPGAGARDAGTMAALTDGVIGERHAVAVVQATVGLLTAQDRAEVDRGWVRVLGRLGVAGGGAGGARGSRPSWTRRRWCGGWRRRPQVAAGDGAAGRRTGWRT